MAPFATQGKFHQISHELFTLSLWMADYSTETGVLMDKRSPIVRTVPEDSGNACQVLSSVLFQDVLRHKSASYDRGCSLPCLDQPEDPQDRAKECEGHIHLLCQDWSIVHSLRVSSPLLAIQPNSH